VDKDVLSPAVLTTNWDQGTMALKTLTAAIRRLTRALPVLGADICGEPPENAREKQIVQSDAVNRALMQTLTA
jgi:arginase family enzyme